MKRVLGIAFFILWSFLQVSAKTQPPNTDFDVLGYDIALKVEPETKSITGSNTIYIKALKSISRISLQLAYNYQISSVLCGSSRLAFSRDSNSFTFSLLKKIKKGDTLIFSVNYSGTPPVAKKAPWDGGFVWSKDSSGNHWVGLACEGLGASSWLPCKESWADEPEWMRMKLIVPPGLIGVSNGRFLGSKNRSDGFTEFNWQVVNPINNYNISVNIGKYEHIEDIYLQANGNKLSLDYYVLSYNVAKARTHFQQVKRMLSAYEGIFGPYPFYEDGYKLVETPYWGMEHQSCVAYGNNYQNNKFGFDFIIVHESGHEWFANSITADDKSDMWIHESFTTYCEALFVEKQYGLARSIQYLLSQKGLIKNELPMIGPRNVNYNRPDNDLYYKGTWILHTMRNVLDNDTLWMNTLHDLHQVFSHKIINTKQVEQFFSQRTKYNFQPFFDQYLNQAEIPVLEYYLVQKNDLNELHYRLLAKANKLQLPVKVTLSKEKYEFLTVTTSWQVLDLPYSNPTEFKLDESRFLVQKKNIKP